MFELPEYLVFAVVSRTPVVLILLTIRTLLEENGGINRCVKRGVLSQHGMLLQLLQRMVKTLGPLVRNFHSKLFTDGGGAFGQRIESVAHCLIRTLSDGV